MPESRDVPHAAPAREPLWSLAVAAFAAILAAMLAPRVLAAAGGAGETATLARALPGAVGDLVARLAGAPVGVALLAATVPLAAWGLASVFARPVGSDPRPVHRGLVLAWAVSAVASLSALLAAPPEPKQGLAALGYALGWPAWLSLAALLGPSRLPRLVTRGALLGVLLALLIVRALPLGWPGETSLSWWPMLPAVPFPALLGSGLGIAVATLTALVVLARVREQRSFASLAPLPVAALLLLRTLPVLEHYGPEKHAAALASEINTSYFQAAGTVGDVGSLVRGHAGRLGSLPMHARTHPPTWPVLFRAAIALGATPGGAALAGFTSTLLGADAGAAAELAASVAERPLAAAQVSGLWLLVALFTLAVAALPLAVWFLTRAIASDVAAGRAAALAVLLPAPLLYFPDVDVLHPVLYCLAVGAWLRRGRGWPWALLAGAIAALLAAFSFGNLALYGAFAALVLFAAPGSRLPLARERNLAVLALLPLAALVAGAMLAGAQPLALFGEAIRQHHAILAHRTRALWMALHPLECAVGLGFPVVLAFAGTRELSALPAGILKRSLAGGELLLGAALAVLLVVDLSGQAKGEAARLWMGWFPLLLAGGCGALESRTRGWGWLAVGLAATVLVLKGFYVFVWLYRLG